MANEPVEQGVMASPRLRPSIPNATTFSSYLGLCFAVFLGLLPHSYQDHLAALLTRNRNLLLKLLHAEDQLRHMQSRRREDSKANDRVVEIFATHRNAWQEEERRLLQQVDLLRARVGELEKSEAELGAMVEKLQREVEEREDVIRFMSKRGEVREEEVCMAQNKVSGNQFMENYGSLVGRVGRVGRIRVSEGLDPLPDVCFSGRGVDADQMGSFLGCHSLHGFSASSGSAPAPNVQEYDTSHDPLYQTKHFLTSKESPWKSDGESKGITSKMRLLEQELVAIEKVGGKDCSKLQSMLRKQAERYKSLTSGVDGLCQRMQARDPSEQTLSSELRTQRQTEFLLETFRLEQRAAETNQKLMALHLETKKKGWEDDLTSLAKLSARRSLDTIKSNFREVQRNIEIWLARIMGDLEGILARDGASRVVKRKTLGGSKRVYSLQTLHGSNQYKSSFGVQGLAKNQSFQSIFG